MGNMMLSGTFGSRLGETLSVPATITVQLLVIILDGQSHCLMMDPGWQLGHLFFNGNGYQEENHSHPDIAWGHTKIFEYNVGADNWVKIGQDLVGESADEMFGISVSLTGDGSRVAIGAIGYNP